MYRMVSTSLILTVISGTAMVISSEKWFVIWVGLEMSTLALVPILCSKFSPRKVEATMKYFLMQALSAALLLKSALMQAWLTGSWSILAPAKYTSSLSMTMALAFKLGLAPCHFWFPDVLQGLPFVQGLMVATWQKMAPLMLLFSFEQLVDSNLVIIIGLLSVLIGGWGGLNQTQVRKILAFSSIGKMGWMVTTSAYSLKAAMIMLMMYLTMKTAMFLLSDFLSLYTLGHLKMMAQLSPMSIVLTTFVMLSLGGLPPLTGFMMKFFSLYFLLGKGFIMPSALLILGSLLSLFFYLRMAFKTSLVLFPHHMITLTSWRKAANMAPFNLKTWTVSTLFILSTAALPLTLSLYMTM